MSWPPDMKTRLALPSGALVTCSCGRQVSADMMRDVRPLKAVIGTTADDLCDSCIEHLHRTQKVTREQFARALGAPPALILKAAKVDRRQRGEQDV